MKKGFTLIELLAVIVILAIIALIATPIVLSIINDSKESATLRSAQFYLDGVEKQRTTSNTCTITGLKTDTDYTVKVEIEDKAGNVGTKEQTVTTESFPNVNNLGALEFSSVTWESGLAKVTIDGLIWNFCADGYGEICVAEPHCECCPIKSHCHYEENK